MSRRTIVGIVFVVVGLSVLVAAVVWVRGAPDEGDAAIAEGGPVGQPGPPPGAVLSVMQATGTCKDCRDVSCRNYLGSGVDIVSGCFEKAHTSVKNPDPKFIDDCIAVVKCAYDHKCGYTANVGPFECFCGSRNPTDCVTKGPAPDAACVAEWKRATRTNDEHEVALRFDDDQYPSGWAFAMLQCDRDACGAKSKVGRCTPP